MTKLIFIIYLSSSRITLTKYINYIFMAADCGDWSVPVLISTNLGSNL